MTTSVLKRMLYAAGLSAILMTVFLLPYRVPSRPGVSISYLMGFNNRVAFVTLLLGSLIFALATHGAGLRLEQASPGPGLPLWRRPSVYVVGATLLITTIMTLWLWKQCLVKGPYREANYFLDRYSMYATGGHLYRDFQFDYGPLLFYAPVWCARLLHLSLGHAYFATWTLQWLAGFVLLWAVIRQMAGTSADRLLVYVFLSATWLTSSVDCGANYTPLRFILSSAAAVVVYRLYNTGREWLAFIGAMLAFAVMFAYSSEQGIVFLAGTVLYFAVCPAAAHAGSVGGIRGCLRWHAGCRRCPGLAAFHAGVQRG